VSKIKQIVIIGGGTAGWLTALYTNKLFGPDTNIKVVESAEIGILGAGESTIPIFISTLAQLKIDFNDFVAKTNAAYKIGINFENWNGDGNSYFHAFGVTNSKSSPYSFNDANTTPYDTSIGNEYIGYLIKNNLSLNDCVLSNALLKHNKSPFVKSGNNLELANYYALQFDASLGAKYFRNLAEKRGVKRIEGIVDSFTQNEKGDIDIIHLKSKENIECDFVFDCTGFKRLVLGELYKTEWNSYGEHLTVNSVIPFFLPSDKDIKPYTRAIAMKYGWMWITPLQSRHGCGYIFDNKYINPDEAKKEVEDYLGHPISVIKNINFKAGSFKKVWVNNCIGIGLSTGFTEPLEATSIWITITQLDLLNWYDLNNPTDEIVELYNNRFCEMNDDILNFLQFHYLTKRKDTEFWKYYTEQAPMKPSLKVMHEKWKNECPVASDFTNLNYFKTSFFSWHGYTCVGVGLDYFDKDIFLKKYEMFPKKDMIELHHKQNMETIENTITKTYGLSESLKIKL